MRHDQPLGALESDLADLARLVAEGSTRSVLLLLARLVRKYRKSSPGLARRLDACHRRLCERTGLGGPLRRRRG